MFAVRCVTTISLLQLVMSNFVDCLQVEGLELIARKVKELIEEIP